MANAFMTGTTGTTGTAAVRAFAEQQRRLLQDEIRVLDEIIHDLAPLDLGEEEPGADPSSAPPAKPKSKCGSRPSANQMAKEAGARREKIVALLLERGEEMSPQAIKAVIPMSQSQATSDFKKLAEDGRIRRNGPQTRPMYEAIVKPGPSPQPPLAARSGERLAPKDGGTNSGRILGYINSTGGATEEALSEHLHLTVEEVRDECGTLIREGEIRFDRSGGVTRYVPEPSA